LRGVILGMAGVKLKDYALERPNIQGHQTKLTFVNSPNTLNK